MRREFKLTEEQHDEIVAASQPVPLIMLQCGIPASPQENANTAWKTLGDALGFVWDSVRPVPGKGNRFFSAELKGTQ